MVPLPGSGDETQMVLTQKSHELNMRITVGVRLSATNELYIYCVALCSDFDFDSVLYCIVLYCILILYIVLYCIVLHCIVY